MQRKRREKGQRVHICLLVNESSLAYQPKPIEQLTKTIRELGGQYTILRPSSATELANASRMVCGLGKRKGLLPSQFDRRGKVTGLVACGGDGTFNLVARAATEANLPVGILPMGRFNNIAMSLYGSTSMEEVIKRITDRGYRKIDIGIVAGQRFIGSIGLGLIPRMARLLEEKKKPRFSLGWSRLASRASALVKAKKTVLKVDSFRFDITPTLLNINLLPYTLGLPLTPASLSDDGHAEIVFDVSAKPKEFSSLARRTFSGNYFFGSSIHLFRGAVITLQYVKERTLYLDGEFLKLPVNAVEVRVGDEQLKVYC